MTFLFTDIEGSTRLWESQADSMRRSLARHDEILRKSIEARGGYVFKTVGDAFCAAFETASDCLDASIDAQLALASEPWEVRGGIRARMALHSGTAEEREGDYFGPTLNRVARLLGIAYGEQVLVSLVTEELLRDILPAEVALRDLGEHRLKDLMHPERVFQVQRPGLRAEFPALKSLDSRPNNLPTQPTPFLGRARELALVEGLLGDEAVRVLSLTGPGGSGKTRLSLQAAADMSEAFEDGLYFVDLSAVDTPDYIIPVIARSLGLRESAGRRHIDLVREFASRRRILLILDNFEQIRGGEPYVLQILAACPGLKLIVTSREALHVRGEQVFQVPPLSAPKLRQACRMEPEQLRQYEAVSLFIERARAILADFTATNENAPAIAEICARQDGLPLAIELAAARILLLDPREMLARLGDQLKLLSGGLSDLPHRQRTLRATIDWSYRLLEPREQALLREISVFAGRTRLEALERICSVEGEDGPLEAISALVAKSLLSREEGRAGPAFVMLESIREYGLEQLEKTGSVPTIREAHARYYLGEAEETRQLLRGPARKRGLEAFEASQDNFQAALDHFHDRGRIEEELRLCAALGDFWRARGYLSAGMAMLERALDRAGDGNAPLRAEVMRLAGAIDIDRGEYGGALARLEIASRLYSEGGKLEGALLCSVSLGEAHRLMGELELARGCFSRVVEGEPGSREGALAAEAKLGLGLLHWQEGDIEGARRLFEDALERGRRLGDVVLQASAAGNLGVLCASGGDDDSAISRYVDACTIHEEQGDLENAIVAHNNIGVVHLRRASWVEARECYSRAQRLARELGNARWQSLALCGLSDAWRGQGDFQRAMETARDAIAMIDRLDPGLERGVCERVLGDAFLALGRPLEASLSYDRALPILESARDEEDLALVKKARERATLLMKDPAPE
jgi:predicted ATPase/class 3 adenylate cyclase/Tfp pilus assembly protein PilF